MFETLRQIYERPRPYEFYTAETLWNDEHTSQQMLNFHLDEGVDLASRTRAFIERSVEWMASRFAIGPGVRIADFGCGPGLYSRRLAERGAAVTGIDFSERSIRYAMQTAADHLDVEYVLQNYLEFSTDKRFDLITLIYCDFCALSPAQRHRLLEKFRTLLDGDGCLLFDVCSLTAFAKQVERAKCERRLLDGFWSADDYFGFLNTFKYEAEKVVLDKYTIVEASRTRVVYNWLQYYSLESITGELEENGFRVVEAYSDVAGAAYDEESPEIAVVAKRC